MAPADAGGASWNIRRSSGCGKDVLGVAMRATRARTARPGTSQERGPEGFLPPLHPEEGWGEGRRTARGPAVNPRSPGWDFVAFARNLMEEGVRKSRRCLFAIRLSPSDESANIVGRLDGGFKRRWGILRRAISSDRVERRSRRHFLPEFGGSQPPFRFLGDQFEVCQYHE